MNIKTISGGLLLTIMFACSSQKKANTQKRPEANSEAKNLFTRFDANKDGKLAKSEVKGPLQNDFAKIDSNNDGFISIKEFEAAPKPQNGQGRPPRRH